MNLFARCGNCRHFSNAAAEVESQLPGLRSLGSAHGAVRGDDGICAKHERYLRSSSVCAAHEIVPVRWPGQTGVAPALPAPS